jgi:hypothetical protein
MKTKRFLKSAFVFVSLFNTLALLLLLLSLALPRVVVVSSAPEEETTTTFDDDAKKKKETSPGMDWKTTTSSSNNCAAKGFDDPSAIRCDYCRFALKEALQDEEITRECLECCTETTGDAKLMMMMSSQFDRATITACS